MNRRLRLLFVTHQYRPAIGGSEKFFSDLAEGLAERGHDVQVATTRSTDYRTWRTALPAADTINGVRVRRFSALARRDYTWRILRRGLSRNRRAGARFADPLVLFGSGPISPGLFAWVAARASRFDVVHLQTLPYAHVVYAGRAAKWAGRPVVITPHVHVEQPEVFGLGAFVRALKRADLVMADTGRERDYLEAAGVGRDRLVEIGVGLRTSDVPEMDPAECRRSLGLPSDAFVALFLGRKVPYKGLTSVVEGVMRLGERQGGVHLVSAGPPSDESRALRARYPANIGWTDLDAVSDRTKAELLNACDALLLPSTAEAFGIVFLEGWALGKPVIGARAGATPWLIVDGHNGLLVDPDSPDQVAAAVRRLAADPGLCAWLGANGRRTLAERYSLDRVAARTEAAYLDLLRRRTGERAATLAAEAASR
jgi:glycosyltransferase involved in cell wall biosynthesis